MGAHQSAVEHQILVLAICREHLEDPFPDPACEALVQRLPLAVALGQIVPMGTRPQHPQTPVQQPVVASRAARVALLAWQKLAYPCPLRIRQLVSLDHPTAPNHMFRNKMNQRQSDL
jgi:hypothetical protein